MRDALWYGIKGQERLNDDIEELLTYHFDNLSELEIREHDFPFEILVHKKIKIKLCEDDILDDVYVNLDEEYGDQDGDYDTKPSSEVKELAQKLVEAIKKDYIPWVCEPTGEVIKYSKDEIFNLFVGEKYE